MASARVQGEEGATALPRRDVSIALGVCVALALFWTIPLSRERAWGWDESMHVAWPAARIWAVSRGVGFEPFSMLERCTDCAQYPFVWPLALAELQVFTGLSEHACRVAGTLAWCATLFGMFLVAREVVEALRRERGERGGDRWVPFVALLLAALCPLALAFSGTLFLEVPATCAIVWAVRAWLVRARKRSWRAELLAGAWISAAFFTKFNYGLLLGLGLGLDWACECVGGLRGGRTAAFLRRTAWLIAIPVLMCVWWFVCPWPQGSATAVEHRQAFVQFLTGNQGFARTPIAWRLWYAGDYFALTPRLLLAEVVLALLALRLVRNPAVRVCVLLLLATCVPIAVHPFHLDRFQIVCGPGLWLCAALGAGALLATGRGRWIAAVALVACLIAPSLDRHPLARWADRLSDEPALRAYQLEIDSDMRDLCGSRKLPTGGLLREEHDQLAQLVRAVEQNSIGWIGMSSEFSPAALELARLVGSEGLRYAPSHLDLDINYFGVDPLWDDAHLAAYARQFGVILWTDPVDLKGRNPAGHEFYKAYEQRLLQLGWSATAIGTVAISRPLKPPLTVVVYACRPNS